MINDWLYFVIVHLAGFLTGAAAVAVWSKRAIRALRADLARVARSRWFDV